ncbi:hypothetical protein ACQ4PT_027912 [Festuca glaucescens]
MDPSQDVSGRVRTRGSIRRDINKVAHTVEECAGERRQVIDKVACAVKKGAAEREAVLSDMDPDVSGRVRTRGSIRCDINKVARAVEECAGERRRDIDKIACDNGACAVKKGAAEREPALSDMDLSQDVSGRVRTRGSIRRDIDKGSRAVEECPGERRRDIAKDNMATDAGEKGLFVNNGIGDKGCYKNGKAYGGSYIYNSEMDNYTLEAIGTEEKRPFVLPGEIYRELLQHQVEGIEWLWGIHCQYPGGIVSDDMGLGKTFQDLYSLLNFISPGLLGDEATFRKKYLRPISLGRYANAAETEKEEYIRALKEVRNATTTYLLRRKKKVLIESGHLRCKKHDMVVWLRLTELQMLLYRKFEKIYSNRIVHQSESAMLKTAIWKDICNSPSLLLNTKGDSETEIALKSELLDSLDAGPLGDKVNSCKATFVLDLVKEIFEEEKKEKDEEAKKKEHKDKEVEINVRKILIFSQSLEMLNLIQGGLNEIVEKHEITRIDGSVKKDTRNDLIERFKSVNGPRIFLLSSKVGGEGLNLTVATRVIIVDPSWNSRVYHSSSQRIVSIVGTTKEIEKAKQMIMDVISEAKKMLPDEQEDYLYVPVNMIGLVIGKQGRMVNEMKRISGAFIKFIDPQNGFLLTGDQQQIDNAEALIWETLNKVAAP